jgi:hypothetical protein
VTSPRKLAWCVVALVAACGKEVMPGPGPVDHLRFPTGLAVHNGRVLAVSSNSDLFYDEATGGTVISLDPVSLTSPVTVDIMSALRVRSFGGDLALARALPPGVGVPDAEACGTAISGDLAIFGTRGSNTLNVLSIGSAGELACERCSIPVGVGYADPLPMAVACAPGRARVFSGYLTTPAGSAFVTELDLQTFALRALAVGPGPVRGLAYDRDRDRLFLAGLATANPTPLRWIDLAGCTIGALPGVGGCTIGEAFLGTPGSGLELRSIAFANPVTPGVPRPAGVPLRAYVTGRLYDLPTAATAGARTTDFGGVIMVLDLVEDALGGITPQVVWIEPIGRGAQDIRVLPRCTDPVCPPNWTATDATRRRDVVAAVSVDAGELTIFDDETHSVAVFRTDDLTGAPVLGHQPFGLAVDPEVVGTRSRVWVGSYGDGFVTPIEVPLDAPDHASYEGGTQTRISGAMP